MIKELSINNALRNPIDTPTTLVRGKSQQS